MRILIIAIIILSVDANAQRRMFVGGGVAEIRFQTGDLEDIYPSETPLQIQARRLANWNILKTVIDLYKISGTTLTLPDTRIEYYRPLNDKISIGSGQTLSLVGESSTDMVFYPFIQRREVTDHTPFQIAYGASVNLTNLNIACAEKQGRHETYTAVLKKDSNPRLIEIQGSVRPGFWQEIEAGNSVYCSFTSATVCDTRVISSFDSVAKTITVTQDMTGDNNTTGKFGRQFTNELMTGDRYRAYGDFWIGWHDSSVKQWAAGIRFIPSANSGTETSFNLSGVSFQNWFEGLSISGGNFHVDYTDISFDNCGVGFGAFARSQLNGQYISGDRMTFTNNGFNCIGQVTADNSLVYGSGGYIHPTVILTITDELILTNNPAAAFRQYSSSIETVMDDVETIVNSITASGNGEYDFYSSNCMPVTIDNFDGDQLWVGGTVTVNGGEIRELVNASTNLQPPNGTPVNWEFNTVTFEGRITSAYNVLTEAVHDIEFNDCVFKMGDYTVTNSFLNVVAELRSITVNNATLTRSSGSTVPDYTPGSAVPVGEKCQYFSVAQGRTITINNMTTDYMKGGLLLEATNLVRTPPYNANKIYINNSTIGLSHLINNGPTTASFWLTNQINGRGSNITSFNYNGLGYNTPFSFGSKAATKSNVNILTSSQTYKNMGGSMAPYTSFSLSGVLEIDLDHDDYFVNAGTINRITLPTWSGVDKIASEAIYSDTITIHAVGGDVVINGYNSSTNEYGNISASTTITSGTSKQFICTNNSVISNTANSTVAQTIGTGNGSEYKGLLTDYLIAPTNFSVTAGAVTGTANSSGAISGTGIDSSSFIDYGTGTYYIKFSSNVGNGVSVNLSYEKFNNWRSTGVFTLLP